MITAEELNKEIDGAVVDLKDVQDDLKHIEELDGGLGAYIATVVNKTISDVNLLKKALNQYLTEHDKRER